tara:strand:+ start:547 stop:1101 length:555 start_codon:yes stop_codon:yes gene_type:complete
MQSINKIQHITIQDSFAKLHSFEIKEGGHPLGYEGKEEHPLGFEDRHYATIYNEGNPVLGIEYEITEDIDDTQLITIVVVHSERTGEVLSPINATRILGVSLNNEEIKIKTTYKLGKETITREHSNRMNGLIVFSHRVTEDGMAKVIFTDDNLEIKGEIIVRAESFNNNVPAYIDSVHVSHIEY